MRSNCRVWNGSRIAGFLVMSVAATASLAAADDRSPGSREPAVVICARSVDVVIDRVEYVLALAGADARIERMREILAFLNELEGIDRERPVGLLVDLPPPGGEPQVVGFVPVAGLDELRETISKIDGVSFSPGESEGQWALRSKQQTLHVRIAAGYAHVAQSEKSLSGELADISEITGDLTNRYDAAVMFERGGLPPAYAVAAIAKLHQDAARDLIRRDDESDAEFELRSRASESLVWLIEQVVVGSERLTLGLTFSREDQAVELEATLKAAKASQLARIFGDLSGNARIPEMAVEEPAGVEVAASLMVTGEGRELLSEVVTQLRAEIDRDLAKDPAAQAVLDQPLSTVLDALESTVDAGRLQASLRVIGDAPGEMVLLAGVGIEKSDDVDAALRQFLPFLAHSEDVKRVDLDAGTVGGVAFHRIVHKRVRKQDRILYGDEPAMYVGAGRDAFWFALGGSDAPQNLDKALSGETSPPSTRGSDGLHPLLEVDIRMQPWIELVSSGSQQQAKAFVTAARAAFAETDQDRLHAEMTAKEGELRLQVRMDEGYIRMLAPVLSARGESHSPEEPAAELLRPRQP